MSSDSNSGSNEEFLTTTAAARFCSVSPNTILKWISEGKITARRTPGGHHRIPRSALEPIIQLRRQATDASARQSGLLYCWEFHKKSHAIDERCLGCVVYRSRAGRCFALANLPSEAGHCRIHCLTSCEDCEFYATFQQDHIKILVVSDRKEVSQLISEEARRRGDWLKFADNEYRSSLLFDSFRPDYVIIDCGQHCDRTREFAKDLSEDPRLPHVRIVLIGEVEQLPRESDGIIYAFVSKPLTRQVLEELLDSF